MADRYRMLSSVSSAEAGRWRTSRVPYMYEIFDKLSPTDPCREVVLMKGVQIAGTEAALNCVGAYIDIEPCPIMYVMPTVDMAKGLSKKRVQHMIQECETLNRKVAQMNRREGVFISIGEILRWWRFDIDGRKLRSGSSVAAYPRADT
jgi:phage terminase large subunit GpA-like protein